MEIEQQVGYVGKEGYTRLVPMDVRKEYAKQPQPEPRSPED